MQGVLVDSNVILDVFLDDQEWAEWAVRTLEKYAETGMLYINPVIYCEVSIAFKRIEELESALGRGGFQLIDIPKEALFLAGKVFQKYKRNKGTRNTPLPDSFIGAHAAVLGLDLATRDIGRYRTYFPSVTLISP